MTDRSSSAEARSRDERMGLMDHIGELRKRLIYIIIVLVLGLVGGVFAASPLYDYLVNRTPAGRIELSAFSPWDAIGLYMKFALVVSLVVAIPFGLFQLWSFVRPALGEKEQKATLRYVPGAFFMFLGGLAFGYFIVFPMAYLFAENVTNSMGLNQLYGVNQYFSFMFNIVVPLAVLFELPVVVMFLSRIGILNPIVLKKLRKIAWFAMVVLGTVITPPDFISDLLVAVPLIALYELSVLLSNWAFKKRQAKLRAMELAMEASE
ncbi:twin-arginine translocase subunit TatC [Cohnella lubricantis]|uniref:Sec-independent protein translocase protein TatC n=1 Tax=Cohnella lubricantis TaxID=2163172 RepID=A0A841T4N9_9BACL|nr:twin-arginine translocase subunit TatC [Cohnella lubricantis]MBB6676523.1 twin-arginine translocase subunit TatC [Cohnella lubricantis]MBP2120515.1 sec-independent protein translocase protein TatC [Cohnella lubricantis]